MTTLDIKLTLPEPLAAGIEPLSMQDIEAEIAAERAS